MKNRLYVMTAAILCLFCCSLLAYPQITLDQILEQEESLSETELSEQLDLLKENPLNINSATTEELQTLPFLTPTVTAKIIDYRNKNGDFNSLDELKCCLDADILELIRPFIKIEETPKEIHLALRNRLIKKHEHDEKFYHNAQVYNKLRFNYGDNIAFGGLAEKDAGENNFTDFYSYYLELSDISHINKMIIGYYRLKFGQGLLFAPYSGSPKTSAATKIKKAGTNLRAYTSASETAGLRGIAIETLWKNLCATFFYSSEKLDANLDEDGTSVISLYETGYHRTDSEMSKKDALTENLIGAHLKYSANGLNLGLVGYAAFYDLPFAPPIERDKFYSFRGKKQQMWSLSLDYIFEGLTGFGELAYDIDSGKALIIGTIGNADNFDWAILYRKYEKDFYSLHGYAFGENSNDPKNEEGFYFGWKYKLNDKTLLTSYIDLWRHPWRKYYETMPTEGNETFFQIQRKLTNNLTLTLRHKQKTDTKTFRIQLDLNAIGNTKIRIRMEQRLNDMQNLSRLPKNELLYVGFGYRPYKNTKIYYQATMYGNLWQDAKIPVYVYERDLPGVLRNVALYDEGFRWYILLKQKVGYVDLSTKYESDSREGSGHKQIRIQIDTKF